MKRCRVSDLHPDGLRLMPDRLGEAKVCRGGVHCFAPGETAHPEPRHVHDTEEVFLFLQGQGFIPINGVEHPVQAGDVVIVEAGEDHHTTSSVENPLVAAWWVMDR